LLAWRGFGTCFIVITSARPWVLALGLGSFSLAASASAGESEAGDPAPLIEELEADKANQAVIAESLGHAKSVMERARAARSTGDVRVTPFLTQLAMEWATTARDVLRAAKAEADAMSAAKKAAEVRTKVDRARTLLAETQARRGQARAELERLKRETGRHGRDVDATAKRAPKSTKTAPKTSPKAAPNPKGPAKP